jgi:hypothetical protein
MRLLSRLSRGGITATIPFGQLVSNPAEDVYAQPGDVLTIVRAPQTFSVFVATGRNAEIPFDTARLTLGEALGRVRKGYATIWPTRRASFFSVTSPTPSYVRSISR